MCFFVKIGFHEENQIKIIWLGCKKVYYVVVITRYLGELLSPGGWSIESIHNFLFFVLFLFMFKISKMWRKIIFKQFFLFYVSGRLDSDTREMKIVPIQNKNICISTMESDWIFFVFFVKTEKWKIQKFKKKYNRAHELKLNTKVLIDNKHLCV